MPAYVVFDVEMRDMNQYQAFYRDRKPIRDACSSARLVSVDGLA